MASPLLFGQHQCLHFFLRTGPKIAYRDNERTDGGALMMMNLKLDLRVATGPTRPSHSAQQITPRISANHGSASLPIYDTNNVKKTKVNIRKLSGRVYKKKSFKGRRDSQQVMNRCNKHINDRVNLLATTTTTFFQLHTID